MNAAACSCRVMIALIFDFLRDSRKSRFSSPGRPKIYSTPSSSSCFTSRSDASNKNIRKGIQLSETEAQEKPAAKQTADSRRGRRESDEPSPRRRKGREGATHRPKTTSLPLSVSPCLRGKKASLLHHDRL